jgi:hypothetical protein
LWILPASLFTFARVKSGPTNISVPAQIVASWVAEIMNNQRGEAADRI